jgi:hypothetical protein
MKCICIFLTLYWLESPQGWDHVGAIGMDEKSNIKMKLNVIGFEHMNFIKLS